MGDYLFGESQLFINKIIESLGQAFTIGTHYPKAFKYLGLNLKQANNEICDALRDLGSVTTWRLHGRSNARKCMLTLFSTFMSFLSVCIS